MAKPNDILNRMRQKRTGAEAFMETMVEQEYETKLEHDSEQETEHVQETEQFIIQKNETEYVRENVHNQQSKNEIEPSHSNNQETGHDTDPVPKTKSILEKYSEKKTKEDLYTRQTYLIRNDLIKRFDKAAQPRRKGFKTDVINELLETFLNENGL